MTGQPYPVFVTQLHIDEFFVNGAVIPLPNYPYITSTSNDPQLLADVETWLNNNGYNAIVNADQILIDSDNLELEFCGDAFLYELNSGGGFTGNTTSGQEDLCYAYESGMDCNNQSTFVWYDLFFDKNTGAFICAFDTLNNLITEETDLPEGIEKLPCPITIKELQDIDFSQKDYESLEICAWVNESGGNGIPHEGPVSYTHLTLPTICSV